MAKFDITPMTYVLTGQPGGRFKIDRKERTNFGRKFLVRKHRVKTRAKKKDQTVVRSLFLLRESTENKRINV